MSRHPEDYCQKCGHWNPVWFAPNELWNKFRGEYNILCPNCFARLCWDGGLNVVWEMKPEE